MMDTIKQRLQALNTSINSVTSANKLPQAVQLLAVSKSQSTAAIREAFAAGQRRFGENYVQECITKQQSLTDLDIEWHFIGPIQSNKTQLIAQHFSWVHSVDRIKIAQRLNDARPTHLPPLQICIQINTSNENTKSGVSIQQLEGLAASFSQFPRLKLRGLMAIPAPSKLEKQQREQFNTVRTCYEQLKNRGLALDTLSIGMSDDYLIAIEQGATILRIGTKIFGTRQHTTQLNDYHETF